MDLTLNNMVIHKFIINKHDGEGVSKTLDLSDKTVVNTNQANNLIQNVLTMYSKRPGKSYGNFEEDMDNYPMSRYLKESLEGHYSFLDATRKMMEHFKLVAPNTAATAHVIFADINYSAKKYLIVFLMNDTSGPAIVNYDVVDTIRLDTSSMRFAGRIDITGWANGEDRYISFLKGTGNASQYFQKFLGCDDVIQARVATTSLRKAVEQFAKDSTMNINQKTHFFTEIYSYLDNLAQNNERFNAEVFANKFSPENPQLFIDIFQHDEFKVPDNFIPHSSSLKRLIRIKGATKDWKLEFDRKAIHENAISYNSDNDTIILSNPPAYLIDQIRDEFEDSTES